MEKVIIKINAITNPGIAANTRDNQVTILSVQEYCFVADITPKGIPKPTAIIIEISASLNVIGNLSLIELDTGFPDDMSEWNTGYITGAMKVTGTFTYEMEQLAFAGTDENSQNIKYVGLNILYYYSVTGDSGAEKIVEDILGASPEDLPERTLVPISKEITDDGMVISVSDAPADIADGAVINTTLAYQDIFVSDSEIADENNLLCVGTGVTRIEFKYPKLGVGILFSLAGVFGMAAIFFVDGKMRRKHISDSQ